MCRSRSRSRPMCRVAETQQTSAPLAREINETYQTVVLLESERHYACTQRGLETLLRVFAVSSPTTTADTKRLTVRQKQRHFCDHQSDGRGDGSMDRRSYLLIYVKPTSRYSIYIRYSKPLGKEDPKVVEEMYACRIALHAAAYSPSAADKPRNPETAI